MKKHPVLSKFIKPLDPHTIASDRHKFQEAVKRHVQKIVRPIFLKEIKSSSGGKDWLMIRPHNFVSVLPLISDFLGVEKTLSEVMGLEHYYKWRITKIPHGRKDKPSWYSYKLTHYLGHKIIITTRLVWIYWHEKLQYRWVENSNPDENANDLNNEFKQKVLGLYEDLRKDFKIKVDKSVWGSFRKFDRNDNELNWGWHRCEIGISGLKIQEEIPEDAYWEGELTKKQYKNEIEAKSIPAFARLTENDALRKFSPMLAQELNNIKLVLAGYQKENLALSNAILLIAQTLKKLEEKL